MADHIIDLIVRLRARAATDNSRPEEWAFGQKPDYLAHVDDLKAKFGVTEAMISSFPARLRANRDDRTTEEGIAVSEMVERVARAIASAEGYNPDGYTGSLLNEDERWWEYYTVQANAAIEAMREPTEQMVVQAYERCHEADSARLDSNIDFAAPTWRTMIDAALGK